MLWWDEKLATGIETIDNQHKSIFQKAEDILSFDRETGMADIKEALSYLIKYTVNHFANEEDAMMQIGYPNFVKHREEHSYFMNEIYKLGIVIRDKGVNQDVVDQLKLLIIEWLINHISESDKAFVDFYKNRDQE